MRNASFAVWSSCAGRWALMVQAVKNDPIYACLFTVVWSTSFCWEQGRILPLFRSDIHTSSRLLMVKHVMLSTILDFKCMNNNSLSDSRNIYQQSKWSKFVLASISLRRIFNFHYITDEVIVRIYCYMLLVNNVVRYRDNVLMIRSKGRIL